MGVESATFINDFDTSLPTSTDLRSQGDDHLRLVKTVLKNSIGGSTRQYQIPGTLVKTTDYAVVKADGNSVIYVSTAGGVVNITMPSLTAGDAGWQVHVIKTNSGASPVFILPNAGTLNSGGFSGLAKARRSIPGVRCTAIWDGSGWFVTRAMALPPGTMFDFDGSTLPAGYEWPNGQTLASAAANYPEYNAQIGSGLTRDLRGRTSFGFDTMGGVASGRLAAGFLNGTVVGNTGGFDGITLDNTTIPNHQHDVFLRDQGHTHGYTRNQAFGASGSGVGIDGASNLAATTALAFTGITIGSVNGVANDNKTALLGGGLAHNNLPPGIILSKILLVE